MSISRTNRGVANPELFTKCQRCGIDIAKTKAASVSFKDETQYFCERCFKAVFKYDPNLKTVNQIWEENGRKTPFTIRSSNWHRSSYMIIKEVKGPEDSNGGSTKTVFVGDMYLRGVLKEQNRNVGKSNHFIWTSWSEELAQKYKEEVEPEPSV